MADDGLLLNFELPSDAFTGPAATFKGGNWKDRLTARKSAEWGRRKAHERATGTKSIPKFQDVRQEDEELILPEDRASKRPKTGEHGNFRPARQSQHNRSTTAHKPLPKSTNGEVISSLFTYNRQSQVPHTEAVQEDEQPVHPSNAPLQDELATFTTLGLSSALASHLLKKLEIKAPTAIQRKAVEQLCRTNTDAFIQAETGSGKTLAYLLPIVQRITSLSKQMKEAGEDFNRESGYVGPFEELCPSASNPSC